MVSGLYCLIGMGRRAFYKERYGFMGRPKKKKPSMYGKIVQNEQLREMMYEHKRARVKKDENQMKDIEDRLKCIGRIWEAEAMKNGEYGRLKYSKKTL